MKTHCYLQKIAFAVVILLLHFSGSGQRTKNITPGPAIYQQKIQKSALLFMENKGQIADSKGNVKPDILFSANSGGAKIYLTASGIHYQFSKTEFPKGYDPFSKEPVKDPQQEEALRRQIKTSTHRFTVELQGANPHPVVSKQQQSSYYENYYLPQCPDGITGVHGYEKIVLKEVYPHIDWVVYSKGGFMEYDFLVHPSGDPANIKLKIKDADKVSITAQGELLMQTSLGKVMEKTPISYVDGQRISSHFKQNNDGTIGFAVQKQPDKELRIDPSIVWSTYYGGSGDDYGTYCTSDNYDNIYLAGTTSSVNGISFSGYQSNLVGYSDAFLSKFDTSGNRLWATYFGGTGSESGRECATYSNSAIYLSGSTSSSTGIAFNGSQNTFGGGNSDAFVVKFGTDGSRIWSSYYGGSYEDYGYGCCADKSGNFYLCGSTRSDNNIAFNGFQNTHQGGSSYSEGYFVRFDANGNRQWATYFGSYGSSAISCAADTLANIYLSGSTNVSSNIAFNGFQNTFGGISDAFLAKFSSSGTRTWSTYYGGSGYESITGVTVDKSNNNVYLSGNTSSLNNIAFNGYQNNHAGGSAYDSYLAKFTPNGARLWATYYGGVSEEGSANCIVDQLGFVYLTGFTWSSSGIASGGFQNNFGGSNSLFLGGDAFVVKFSGNGGRQWASYFGGQGVDAGVAGTVDPNGNFYFNGNTQSASGIASGGFQNTFGSSGTNSNDAFLVKIKDIVCIAATVPTISISSDTICTGSSTTLSITSGNLNSATTWQWRKDSCNGAPVGTGTSITISPTATTTYFVKGEGGCATPSNCISKTIVVRPSVTPAVNLSASPSGPITSGTPVTFTATAVNGGTAPTFAFRVNGMMVQSNGSNTYTSSILQNGDIVTVTLNSNAFCLNTTIPPSDTITIIVAAPCIPAITPAISTNYDTVCSGATPTLTVASGNLNSSTSWQWYTDSCGGTPLGNGTSITVTPAATTTYYLRAEGGCTAPGTCVSKTIYVKQKPVVTFTATPASLCVGDTATITFTGTAPADAVYTWNWGGGTVISGSNAGPYKVKYSVTGNIALTVNNGFCSAAATDQAITVIPEPELSFNISDSIGCDTLAVTLSANPLNINSWTWNFGDGITVDNINTPIQHTYAVGSYTASITVRRGACTNTASRHITVYKKPTASFSALPGINTPVMLNQALFNFTNASQNATQYLWRFGDNTTSSLLNPSHRYMQAGSYAVKLLAYSSPRCVDSVELKPFIVLADTVSAFTIPNAFSPNKDGINDTWMISGIQMATNAKVSIFNRWGQTVFNSIGYNKPWDGTLNGKALPIDTYYYVITVNNKSYTGSVTLLR